MPFARSTTSPGKTMIAAKPGDCLPVFLLVAYFDPVWIQGRKDEMPFADQA